MLLLPAICSITVGFQVVIPFSFTWVIPPNQGFCRIWKLSWWPLQKTNKGSKGYPRQCTGIKEAGCNDFQKMSHHEGNMFWGSPLEMVVRNYILKLTCVGDEQTVLEGGVKCVIHLESLHSHKSLKSSFP